MKLSLVTILRAKIDAAEQLELQVEGTKDKNVIFIYEWCRFPLCYIVYIHLKQVLSLFSVNRFALDNVCEGVLGFKLDSLHNPACELYNTLEDMSRLPSGGSYI